jgi:hypothetical protein
MGDTTCAMLETRPRIAHVRASRWTATLGHCNQQGTEVDCNWVRSVGSSCHSRPCGWPKAVPIGRWPSWGNAPASVILDLVTESVRVTKCSRWRATLPSARMENAQLLAAGIPIACCGGAKREVAQRVGIGFGLASFFHLTIGNW